MQSIRSTASKSCFHGISPQSLLNLHPAPHNPSQSTCPDGFRLALTKRVSPARKITLSNHRSDMKWKIHRTTEFRTAESEPMIVIEIQVFMLNKLKICLFRESGFHRNVALETIPTSPSFSALLTEQGTPHAKNINFHFNFVRTNLFSWQRLSRSYEYAQSDESQTFFPEPSQFGSRTGVFNRSPGYQENLQLFEFLTQGRCEIALWEALSGA